jgi:hypothetical protein
MAGRMRAAAVAVITTGLIVAGASPAFAPYTRTAAEAINPTEACPKYLSLEVASMAPDPGPKGPVVTVQAYSPASKVGDPTALVLERTIPVREVEPDLFPLGEENENFGYHGRAVLLWDIGRLAPDATVAVTTPDAVSDGGGEFAPATVSSRCDPPNLGLSRTCSPTASGPHTWRVRNPEQVAVDFNAEVLGTRPVQIHIGTVPANGEATFRTTQVPGPDIVALFVGGIPVNLGICLR